MEQIIQLKLNVTNIKSYLISSNKQLKKLRVEKSNLIAKDNKKKKILKVLQNNWDLSVKQLVELLKIF
jgi:bifunctional ADP-heptose synthase (sugar kinase/adenylyltransferase)